MAEQAEQRTLMSAVEQTKLDITLLVVQCRAYAGAMFKCVASGRGDIGTIYWTFMEHFYQLYMVFSFNASETHKVKDWDKKRLYFDAYFDEMLTHRKVDARKALIMFRELLEEIIRSGIYNLSQDNYYTKGMV